VTPTGTTTVTTTVTRTVTPNGTTTTTRTDTTTQATSPATTTISPSTYQTTQNTVPSQSQNVQATTSPTPSVVSAQQSNNAVITNSSVQKNCTSSPNASQTCILCSLLTPIVPSRVLAQATAMSSEASVLSQNITAPVTLPAQTNDAASLPVQSIFEFSLLGLGTPTLLLGVLYLLLRRI